MKFRGWDVEGVGNGDVRESDGKAPLNMEKD